MKRFFSSLKKYALVALSKLKMVDDPRVKKMIFDAAQEVHDLIEDALPSIEIAAQVLTPNSEMDDKLVQALGALNLTAGQVIEMGRRDRDNTLLDLGVEILYNTLQEKITSAGGIKVGQIEITNSDYAQKLERSLLRAAIDYGYRVVVKQIHNSEAVKA